MLMLLGPQPASVLCRHPLPSASCASPGVWGPWVTLICQPCGQHPARGVVAPSLQGGPCGRVWGLVASVLFTWTASHRNLTTTRAPGMCSCWAAASCSKLSDVPLRGSSLWSDPWEGLSFPHRTLSLVREGGKGREDSEFPTALF